MKRLLSLIVLVFAVGMAGSLFAAENGVKTGVVFDSLVFDFGNVKENAGKVQHVFEFTNQGTSPVSVLSAKASCGCTVPKFSRKPVEPGQKGRITVIFRTKNQRGEQNKSVRLRIKNSKGDEENITLNINGVVVP